MTSAMMLVAGRGERLRPLTDTLPKPLIPDADGVPLLARWLHRLRDAEVPSVVLNPCWLGDAIERLVEAGAPWGVTIRMSREDPPGLETAGGIRTALPLIASDPFLVINGDVDLADTWSLVAFLRRGEALLAENPTLEGYLLLVPNPPDHPDGDFTVAEEGVLLPAADTTRGIPYTFAGVALYRAALVADLPPQTRAPLGPRLRARINAGRIAFEISEEPWWDIGTPERLARWRIGRKAASPSCGKMTDSPVGHPPERDDDPFDQPTRK